MYKVRTLELLFKINAKRPSEISPKRYFVFTVKTPFISNAAFRKITMNTGFVIRALQRNFNSQMNVS